MQEEANIDVSSGEDDCFEKLIGAIAYYRGETEEVITPKVHMLIARAEAIRYVQLGNPENLLVDDGSIREAVLTWRGDAAGRNVDDIGFHDQPTH